MQKKKDIILKNCAPFTDYISKINSTHLDTVKDIDAVIPMSKLMRYSDSYSKASEILYQFCRYQPEHPIKDSLSFKFISTFIDKANKAGIINEEIAVSLKYLINFLENSSNGFN